jgi:hypothetical protein
MIRNEKALIVSGLLVTFISTAIITFLFLFSNLSSLLYKSILLGTFLSFLNFTVGFLLIKLSIKKSDKLFLTLLWGGLLFRLLISLSLVIITLKFLEINAYGFIFSIFFFYIFYLIIEILYLNLRRKSQFDGKQ